MPKRSGCGTEGASGGGASQTPPGLGELRRLPGFVGRGLELSVFVIHGADVLAKDEGGGAGR